jgi:hypothetical protein
MVCFNMSKVEKKIILFVYLYLGIMLIMVVSKVIILGVQRPFGEHTKRTGGPIHYALYEPGMVL